MEAGKRDAHRRENEEPKALVRIAVHRCNVAPELGMVEQELRSEKNRCRRHESNLDSMSVSKSRSGMGGRVNDLVLAPQGTLARNLALSQQGIGFLA